MTTTNQDLLDKVARLEDRIELQRREIMYCREQRKKQEEEDGEIIKGLAAQVKELKGKL